MHFVIPRQYEAIVPAIARWKRELVVASSVANSRAAWRCSRSARVAARAGGCWPALAAVYPANIQMALHPEQISKERSC